MGTTQTPAMKRPCTRQPTSEASPAPQTSRWKSYAEAQLRLDSPSTQISTPTRPESTPTPTDKSSVDMPSRSSDGDKRKTEPTTGSSLTVGAQAGECLDSSTLPSASVESTLTSMLVTPHNSNPLSV